MSPDEVCEEYAKKGAKITLKLLDEEFVLLEAEADGLEFFGKLLLAHANASADSHAQLGPHSAGNVFFSPESTKGIYIHHLPCSSRNNNQG